MSYIEEKVRIKIVEMLKQFRDGNPKIQVVDDFDCINRTKLAALLLEYEDEGITSALLDKAMLLDSKFRKLFSEFIRGRDNIISEFRKETIDTLISFYKPEINYFLEEIISDEYWEEKDNYDEIIKDKKLFNPKIGNIITSHLLPANGFLIKTKK